MINALIIDDDGRARYSLNKLLLTYCPSIKIVDEASTIASGIQVLQHTSVDLVFLDIHLNDGLGFELLDHFPDPNFQVLFTTAYDQFALKAFRYHAIDYLLKPISPDELIQAIRKVHYSISNFQKMGQQFSRLLHNVKTRAFNTITLSTHEGLYVLSLDRIVRLESSGSYTTFFTLDDEKIVIARTIKEYEDLLPTALFLRIHRSHIVNLQHIKGIMKEEGGYVLSADMARLPPCSSKKRTIDRAAEK